MATSYTYHTPTENWVPVNTAPVTDAQLESLLGRRVCIHSGLMSITARLQRGLGGTFAVKVDEGMVAYADARIYPDRIASISYSRDTLTIDGVVAYIYMR